MSNYFAVCQLGTGKTHPSNYSFASKGDVGETELFVICRLLTQISQVS